MFNKVSIQQQYAYAATLYALPPFEETKIFSLQTENLNPLSQVSSMITFALQTILAI